MSAHVARDLEKLRRNLLFLPLLVAWVGCDGTPDGTDAGRDAGRDVGVFVDHTTPSLETDADFLQLAASTDTRHVVKFIITEFQDRPARDIRYLDSNFYTLHDEWYWFRLLNGAAVPGVDAPPYAGRFATIEEIYTWAKDQDSLPLDLRWVSDGRLYSPTFYSLSLSEPRSLGLGSLIFVPARTEPEVRDAVWLFQLEYSDNLDHEALVRFFEEVDRTAPESVRGEVFWLVRSPFQEQLAQRMESEQLAYWDRIKRVADITIPGEVEVYNAGLTAGRIRIVAAGEPLGDSNADDILVLEQAPDWLPPGTGLITATPQTPLAHVNVLAKNRGIPNAYLGAALDDPRLTQLAPLRAPAIIRAISPDQLDIVAISDTEFNVWRQLGQKPLGAAPPVDLRNAPSFVDLSTHTLSQMDALRPLIGGKSAGFLALLEASTVTTPDTPAALTLRPYVEHTSSFDRAIGDMLQLGEFNAHARVRYLMLEGPDRYDVRYPDAADQSFKDAVMSGQPAGTDIGDIIRVGGLAAAIRDKPMRADRIAAIEAALRAHFSALGPNQGLRFRSSSNIEDIEGFNGAGLYDSNTGFLDPELQTDPKEQTRSVEWALKKTWASYWRFEAFEERRLENIDHISGGMGVLVHPRFDDPKELANGVITLTVMPRFESDDVVMIVNVQDGAVSVTNPEVGSDALPEVNRVSRRRGESALMIERVRASTLVEPGARVLSDAELEALFEQTLEVTELWSTARNEPLPRAQRSGTLTLDFEMKKMAEGWPQMANGQTRAGGLILKQARPLEPGARTVPELVREQAIPRDVLSRARRVLRHVCTGVDLEITVWDLYGDPLAEPDMGFSTSPLTASVEVAAVSDVPELGLAQGESLTEDHLALTVLDSTSIDSELPWHLSVSGPGPLLGLSIDVGEMLSVTTSSGAVSNISVSCESEIMFSTPGDYLAYLLDTKLP